MTRRFIKVNPGRALPVAPTKFLAVQVNGSSCAPQLVPALKRRMRIYFFCFLSWEAGERASIECVLRRRLVCTSKGSVPLGRVVYPTGALQNLSGATVFPTPIPSCRQQSNFYARKSCGTFFGTITSRRVFQHRQRHECTEPHIRVVSGSRTFELHFIRSSDVVACR